MKKVMAVLLFLLSGTALADASVSVRDAWIRAMPPTAKNSAAYLVIENRGVQDDELLGATVEGAEVTELHEMVHEGHAMTMRQRESIAIPAARTVDLKPGGLHLMLINLRQPLLAGEQRNAVLRLRKAGELGVQFEVRAR